MKQFVLIMVIVIGVSHAVYAAPAKSASKPKKSSPTKSFYEQGMEKAKQKKYQQALDLFKKAEAKDSSHPETLNMIAFTSRKLGNLEVAFAYYKKALSLKPDFPEAREYLGEAHLQAALKQLEILQEYGTEGEKSYKELRLAIDRAARASKSRNMEVMSSSW